MDVTKGEKFTLKCPACFDLALCLDCGQAFRWENTDGVWHGVIGKREFYLSQNGSVLTVYGKKDGESEKILNEYFDFGRDYDEILGKLCEDGFLKAARDEYYGIRILRQ